MYCKYCAGALGQNDVRKCPNCGASINLLDGGQSFFEDADLQAWRERPADNDVSMPKTEVQPVKNYAKPNVARNSKAATHRNVNNAMVVKTGIVCITVVVALALIALLVLLLKNIFTGSDLSDDEGKNANKNKKTENVSSDIYSLDKIIDEYINGEDEQYESDDKTSEAQDVKDDEITTFYLYNNIIENQANSVDYKEVTGEHRAVGVVDDEKIYVSIDAMAKILGWYGVESLYSDEKVSDKEYRYFFNGAGFNLVFKDTKFLELDKENGNLDPKDIDLYYRHTSSGFHCFEYEFLLKQMGLKSIGEPRYDNDKERYEIRFKVNDGEEADIGGMSKPQPKD